jgi:hypothetical protein
MIQVSEELWNEFCKVAVEVAPRPYGAVKAAIKEALELFIKTKRGTRR